MSLSLTSALRVGTALAALALAHPASADVLLQTATLDPGAIAAANSLVLQGDGTTAGDGFSGGSHFIGADFTVAGPTQLTDIGASFVNTAQQAATGPIFGAIVEVDPVTGLPTQDVENLASITLAEAVFTPDADGDTTVPLSASLQPGTYGLVFGSGLFGATGVADLLSGNDIVGSPSIFENDFAPFAQDPSDIDVRLFADGTVPEPGSLPLLLSASLLLASLARRRS